MAQLSKLQSDSKDKNMENLASDHQALCKLII